MERQINEIKIETQIQAKTLYMMKQKTLEMEETNMESEKCTCRKIQRGSEPSI